MTEWMKTAIDELTAQGVEVDFFTANAWNEVSPATQFKMFILLQDKLKKQAGKVQALETYKQQVQKEVEEEKPLEERFYKLECYTSYLEKRRQELEKRVEAVETEHEPDYDDIAQALDETFASSCAHDELESKVDDLKEQVANLREALIKHKVVVRFE